MRHFYNILLSLICFAGLAQSVKFRNISTDHGLSVGFVQTVIQDSRGFMWFGTQDGLNKYDGYEVHVFRNNPKDPHSLSNNDILCLHEDKSNIIWIGTNGGGLEEYNPALNKFTHHTVGVSGSIGNNTVRCVYEDAKGGLWIGTDNGLSFYDKKAKAFTNYSSGDAKNTIRGKVVKCIAETSNGVIWIGTEDGGLNSFNPSTKIFEYYPLPQTLLQSGDLEYLNEYRTRAISLYAKDDGTLFVGTDGGLGIFNCTEKKYKNFALFYSNGSSELLTENNRIWSIAKGKTDDYWMAAYGGGLIQYNSSTGKYVMHQKRINDLTSLNSNDIYSVFVDNQDNVWAATQNGGVNVFFRYSTKFKHLETSVNSEIPLNNKFIFSIMQDRSGIVWLGTDGGGVQMLDLKNKKTSSRNDIIKNEQDKWVLSMLQDKDGDIWTGTYGFGVFCYNPKTTNSEVYFDNDATTATILSIYQSENGEMWFGTFGGGLIRFNKKEKTFKNYTSADGLPNDVVYSIFEDDIHNIWIGTEGGGACYKNINDYDNPKKPFITFSKKNNAISSNKIFCFYQDPQMNMWIGTSNGLNKVEKISRKIISYYESDGLPNGNIYGIIPDKKGNLWMTTNKGLSRFNPTIENVEGSAFKNFDLKDGLQGMEFNQGAFCLGKNGDIFIGGENGLNIFNPEKITDNPHVPPVFITSYKRFGKEVLFDSTITHKRHIELDYRDNSFSVDFVALDYLMPSENKFQYILEGVDEKWSAPSSFRHATYTQLEGGDYVFKIKAANSDGVWNEVPLTISVHVNPPWWKTKLFYTICIILITSGVFAFIKFRTAQLEKEKKVLEQKVAERTYELEHKNQEILSSIQYAKRIQEAILPPRSTISGKLPESFILYKPKDIVSGDFYWFGEKNNLKIFAVVDCTGHGVPGAFMSMIGHNLMHQIVNEKGIYDPGSILTHLHMGVQSALKQGVNEEVRTADGMDVALVSINTETYEIKYSGANRSLVIVYANGELDRIEANKFPIGGSQLDTNRVFTTHSKTLSKHDTLYMFSDGYADQFGGEKGKKYMVKRFHEFLCSIQEYPMHVQHDMLNNNIENWKGNIEQVDDILVAGVRL